MESLGDILKRLQQQSISNADVIPDWVEELEKEEEDDWEDFIENETYEASKVSIPEQNKESIKKLQEEEKSKPLEKLKERVEQSQDKIKKEDSKPNHNETHLNPKVTPKNNIDSPNITPYKSAWGSPGGNRKRH